MEDTSSKVTVTHSLSTLARVSGAASSCRGSAKKSSSALQAENVTAAIAATAIAINLKFFFITLFIKKLNKRYAHVKSFLAMDSQRTGADKLSKRNVRYLYDEPCFILIERQLPVVAESHCSSSRSSDSSHLSRLPSLHQWQRVRQTFAGTYSCRYSSDFHRIPF